MTLLRCSYYKLICKNYSKNLIFYYCTFNSLSSVFYSKWVPYLTDPQFNISTTTNGIIQPNPNNQEYKAKYFEESLTVNALGASLIALAIVMPILVLHPKFRFRPQRIITVTHDRYG